MVPQYIVTMRRNIPSVLFIAGLAGAGVAGACSGSSGNNTNQGKGGKGGLEGGTCTNLCFNFGGDGSTNPNGLSITPPSTSVTINPADGTPKGIQFTVHGADAGSIGWHSSNPNVGVVDGNGMFFPTGQAGGVVNVEATVGNTTVKATVTVTINYEQNGASGANADAGAGGLEGVGGEGFGATVPDNVLTALKGTPGTDASLKMLYPYDQTVFPLSILPPLLQWSRGSHGNFDAVYIHITAGQYYDYKGYFGRPALLANGLDFVRHPIPADVWKSATLTAEGSTMQVSVVVDAGGKAYGPMNQTYNIALAPINGRVYYQAYATAFVKNSIDGEGFVIWNKASNERFGAATLSIDVGADSPKLVAGADGDASGVGCRVCHSVSAYGDKMVVQHGDQYDRTSIYDLKNGNAEKVIQPDDKLGWAGF